MMYGASGLFLWGKPELRSLLRNEEVPGTVCLFLNELIEMCLMLHEVDSQLVLVAAEKSQAMMTNDQHLKVI